MFNQYDTYTLKSHYLSQSWPGSVLPYSAAGEQWINEIGLLTQTYEDDDFSVHFHRFETANEAHAMS